MNAPAGVVRVPGLDLARGLAFLGMLVVNFRGASGASGDGATAALEHMLEGRAAAVFVMLAGVGVALRRSRHAAAAVPRAALLRRAAVFFLFGYAWSPLWSSDILHYYGVYLLLGALLMDASTLALCGALFLLTWGFTMLYLSVPYWEAWSPVENAYRDPWSAHGLARSLLYDGWHPVVPWFAFFVTGLVIGRRLARGISFGAPSAAVSACLALAVEFASSRLDRTLAGSVGNLAEAFPRLAEIRALFATGPFPPGPLFIAAASAWAFAAISASLVLAQRFPRQTAPLTAVGRVALSLYVLHVVLGVWVLQKSDWLPSRSEDFVLAFTLTFAVACVVASVAWTDRHERGPLEGAVRFIERWRRPSAPL